MYLFIVLLNLLDCPRRWWMFSAKKPCVRDKYSLLLFWSTWNHPRVFFWFFFLLRSVLFNHCVYIHISTNYEHTYNYYQVRIRKLIYSTWENSTLNYYIVLQFQKPKVTVAPLFFQFECIYKNVSDLRVGDQRKAYRC